MQTIGAEARERGVDFCYLIHRSGIPIIDALRRPFLRSVAPLIPYAIIGNDLRAGGQLIRSPYIDIRDV
jgi:hypothetical protein